MDKMLLCGLLTDASVSQGAVFDDLLPVAIGIRRASQIIIPGELPDAAEIGRTIDGRFRLKLAGQRLPGESLLTFVRDRLGLARARGRAAELRQRTDILRSIASFVTGRSVAYRSLMGWIERLGLQTKELESRPTIRELYVFKDSAVAAELDELQALRRAARQDTSKLPGDAPVYVRAFPEETSEAFMRKLGGILGFPACCVDSYLADRRSGALSPETRASEQAAPVPGTAGEEPFAFFAKDFFPCRPDCSSAASIGRAIYEQLKALDETAAGQYERRLRGNIDLVREYPELLRRKIDALERARMAAAH